MENKENDLTSSFSGVTVDHEGHDQKEVTKDNDLEEFTTEEGIVKNLQIQLEVEISKADDYLRRLARMQADFDNYRKRVVREKEDFHRNATEQLIMSLLPVLDNLERAQTVNNEDINKLTAGVEMICRQLQDVLVKEGLKTIPSVGEQFNPEIHEAVMRAENSGYPENTVIEELRRGYTLNDKVIRASMVKVSC